MTDDADQVSLKALKDATRRMRGHLLALDVWVEQMAGVMADEQADSDATP